MKIVLLLSIILIATPCLAGDREYRPGGPPFQEVWKRFYQGNHEPELDDPLIAAGSKMTLVICEAIAHEDMKMRRYAIGALGYIGDRRALPTLEAILRNKDEIYYFRGDALQAIYQIDRDLGTSYANVYEDTHEYLRRIADAIKKREQWLTEPSEE